MSFVSPFGLIIFIVDIIITTALVVILLKRYQTTRINGVLLLALFYLMDLGVIALEFPKFLANYSNPADFYLMPDNPFTLYFSLLGMSSAGIFLLFINYFGKDRISIQHSIVFMGFLSVFSVFVFFTEFFGIQDVSLGNTPISFEFLPVFFLTYVMIASLRDLILMRRQSTDKNQRKQINLMIIAIIFYYVNTSALIGIGENIDHLLTADNTVLMVHLLPRASVVIGDFLLFYAYALTRVAFLQMKHMEKLIVINKSGLPLFSYDFGETKTDDKDVLLSGGLTAITQLLRETLQVSDIEMIQFKEKQLLVSQINGSGAFLVVDQPTSFLRQALHRFHTDLQRKYTQELQKDQNVKEIKDYQLVHTSFGL